MNTTLPTLKQECLAEFLGTGLFLFLGISCLAAMKLAAASFGLWEICIVWGLSVALAREVMERQNIKLIWQE